MNNSFNQVPAVAESVLNHIEEVIAGANDKQFSDEILLTLHSVFGVVLQRALDILEKYPVLETYTTTDKTRSLIEIKGDNNQCYRIFPRVNYCSCLAFKYLVLEKNSQITCKHVLAGRIALMLNKTANHEVTQDQYLMLIRSMFEL